MCLPVPCFSLPGQFAGSFHILAWFCRTGWCLGLLLNTSSLDGAGSGKVGNQILFSWKEHSCTLTAYRSGQVTGNCICHCQSTTSPAKHLDVHSFSDATFCPTPLANVLDACCTTPWHASKIHHPVLLRGSLLLVH